MWSNYVVKTSVPLKRWLRLVSAKPFISLTTIDSGGNVNAMPGRIFTPVSYWPPMIMIGVAPFEDTYANIRDIGEFVVNVPGKDILQKLWVAAQRFPKKINELEVAGLTEAQSEKIKPPHVQECKIHLECKLEWMKRAGDHFAIVGQVLTISADRQILTEDYRLKLPETRFVYDLGFSGSPYGPDFAELGRKVIHVNKLGSKKYEIAPFKEWLSEMEESGILTSEKKKIIGDLAEKLEKEEDREVYVAYKERLTNLLREIIESWYHGEKSVVSKLKSQFKRVEALRNEVIVR